jgi:hypothetical protein
VALSPELWEPHVFTLYKSSEQGQKPEMSNCIYIKIAISTVFRNHCRLQAQRGNSEAAYKGMSDVFWRTLKHEGISGFYKGILPNLLKVVPAASITYMVYEAMKKNLSLD